MIPVAPQDPATRRAARDIVPPAAGQAAHLTRRQSEVLHLAAQGLSGKQIARRLGLSLRTVEDHFGAMRQRTGSRSQAELMAFAAAAGLLKPTMPAESREEVRPGKPS